MREKRSTLAGTWYPGEPDRLRTQVDGLLGLAQVAAEQAPIAVVVPHAGYQYSGATAAQSYRLLRGQTLERIVILAPSHRHSFHGAVVAPYDRFVTPLGVAAVDRIGESLADNEIVTVDSIPFEAEHSLEIQIPFLQRALADVPIVPFLLGSMAGEDYKRFGAVLRRLITDRTVVVISSDFTHYGASFGYLPFPPNGAEEVRASIEQLDRGAIRSVLAGDAAGFVSYVQRTGATICGRIPITAFLASGVPHGPGELLGYTTSLDLTGDYEHSVSYAAVAFPRLSAA